MFGKKENNILVDHWLAYCISLTTRRHGVYVNREEIEKHFPEKSSPKSIKDLNDFLVEKKLEAKAINISLNDLKSKSILFFLALSPCRMAVNNRLEFTKERR